MSDDTCTTAAVAIHPSSTIEDRSSSESRLLLIRLLDEVKAMRETQTQQSIIIQQLAEGQRSLSQQMQVIESKMTNNAFGIATQLLVKNTGTPMKALWEALNGGIWPGIEVPIAIITQCGIEKRATTADGTFKGKSGLELNTTQGGATPLILAAHAERLDVMAELLATGADVGGAEQIYSLTALHVAAIVGQIEAIELLMKYNANVEGADASIARSSHISPLSQAAFNGRDEAITLLVNTYGAKINSQGSDGSTALYYAATRGHSKTAAHLLALGIDTCSRPSALHELAKKGKVDGIETILSNGALVDERSASTGNTALHVAASNGKVDVAKILLAEGADPTLTNNKGQTPLQAFEDAATVYEIRNMANEDKKRLRLLLGPRIEEEPSLGDLFN